MFQATEQLGAPLLDPRHACLITSILSDKQARIPTFGTPNALELSCPDAAKIGTTDDNRDAWTIGYTPDLVTAVWGTIAKSHEARPRSADTHSLA